MGERKFHFFFIRIISGFEKGLYDMEDLQPTLWRVKSACAHREALEKPGKRNTQGHHPKERDI